MKLTVSLAQIEVTPGNPQANLSKADTWTAEAARRGSDIVVFPEMWTTGFEWEKLQELAASSEEIAAEVAALARKHRVWLAGSLLALNEAGQATNTFIMFDPTGQPAGLYRKIHLFGLMAENRHLAPGKGLTRVETPWGQAGLAVCYDLRFPEMFRTYALNGVMLVFLPAQWPHPRLAHWRTLLRARAIENQIFMIGVNSVGRDQMSNFCGHSALIDPWGNVVVEAGETELLLTATIDTELVSEVRQKITVFNDRQPELYRLE
jgi:omega-amidase